MRTTREVYWVVSVFFFFVVTGFYFSVRFFAHPLAPVRLESS